MSRRNLREHFEEMYLRYNMAAKYMSKADQSILDDIQFKRVVSYMSGIYFNKYKSLLVHNGFDYDDLHNIIMVFGLTYWGHSSPSARDKKAFMFMMRYIGQRVQTLVRWISRKFSADDASVITSDSFQFLSDQSIFGASTANQYDESDPSLEYAEDEIEALEQSPPDRYVNRMVRERKKILSASRKKKARQRMTDTILTDQLRQKLNANPMKYKEQLCYYATSKHVSKDVRTKAKLICKKYGIDYVQWLKDKSVSIDFDSNHFTF